MNWPARCGLRVSQCTRDVREPAVIEVIRRHGAGGGLRHEDVIAAVDIEPVRNLADAVGHIGARHEAVTVDAEGVDLVGGFLRDDRCIPVAIELHLGGACAGRAQCSCAPGDGFQIAVVIQVEAGDRVTAYVEHVDDIVVDRDTDRSDTTRRLDIAETETVAGDDER